MPILFVKATEIKLLTRKDGVKQRYHVGESVHVVSVAGGMPLGPDKSKWKKEALSWLLSDGHVRGSVTIASNKTQVQIERDGLKEAVRRASTVDDVALRVIGHIGELLQSAVLKNSEPADGKVKQRGEAVIGYHHYYAAAKFNGKLILAHMPVMETDRGHLFYDCKTLEMKTPEPDSATQHPESGLQPRARRPGVDVTMAEFNAAVNHAWTARIDARKVSGRYVDPLQKAFGVIWRTVHPIDWAQAHGRLL